MICSIKRVQGQGNLFLAEGMSCPENVTFYLMLKEGVKLSYLEIEIRARLAVPRIQIAQAVTHRCVK